MESVLLPPPNYSSSSTPSTSQSSLYSSFLFTSGALLAVAGTVAYYYVERGLRGQVPPLRQKALKISAIYAAFNGLALLEISLHPRFSAHHYAGIAILAGTIASSGSIAALVLDNERFQFLAAFVVIGILAFISGYIFLAFCWISGYFSETLYVFHTHA